MQTWRLYAGLIHVDSSNREEGGGDEASIQEKGEKEKMEMSEAG